MKISVKSIIGKSFYIEAPKEETIGGLKRFLYSSTGISPSQQSLILLGNLIEDTVNLQSIPKNSELILIPILEGGGQISIKMISGKSITVNVSVETGKISDVNNAINEKWGIPNAQQKLIFGGTVLDCNKFLKDYDIGNQSIITLIPILEGGDN